MIIETLIASVFIPKNTVYTEEMNENLIKIQILAPPPTQYIFF